MASRGGGTKHATIRATSSSSRQSRVASRSKSFSSRHTTLGGDISVSSANTELDDTTVDGVVHCETGRGTNSVKVI